MNYINTETNQYPISEREIIAAHPNTSFPDPFVAPDGYAPVFPAPLPEYSAITHRVREGTPLLTAKGHYEQTWTVVALSKEQVTANLATARAAKWEAIKAERDRRKVLGVKVGEHWFHSDVESRIQQISLYVMGAAVPPIPWKTLTNTSPPVFVTMTQGIAAGIFQATAASDTSVFAAAESHRSAMEASNRPDLYDFGGGWPPSIEDTP